MNMNLLITTSKVKIKNIPSGVIRNELYSLLSTNVVYNAEINTHMLLFENTYSYLGYICMMFFFAVIFIINLFDLPGNNLLKKRSYFTESLMEFPGH